MIDGENASASAEAEQALASRAQGLGPSGFDPSRAWRTDMPPYMNRPIYQFVLLEGYQEHSGRIWARKFAGTASISNAPDNRWGYRREDIDRIQRDGDMIVVERVAGWVPAVWPRWDWFMPAQGIEARSDKTRSVLVEDESPVRQDAPKYSQGNNQ